MPDRRRRRPVALGVLAASAASFAFGGCATGERPTFADSEFAAGQATGDTAIDAVLARLDAAASTPPTFTAAYDVVVRFGNTNKHATVAVDGRSRSVTMDAVRYLQTPELIQTCRADACTTGLDPTAISDSQLTVDFYAADAAKRLRVDAAAKIGPTVARTEQLAGQTANCVDIVQSGATATYCVLDDGVLAKLVDGDVYVTMSEFSPAVDPGAFTTERPTTTTSS